MKLPHFPFHSFLLPLALLAASSVAAQSPDNPAPDTLAKSETPAPKPKKVWTNENISASGGQISIVGDQGSSGARGARSNASFSNGATFLTPPDGSIVHPGDTLHVDLSVAGGQSGGFVALVSPVGSDMRKSPPYSFTINVPRGDHQAMGGDRLLGIHAITAYGKQDDGLAAIQVDVEESEMPAKMYARGNIQNLHGLQELKLFDAGSQQSLTIYGTFPNGDDLDLINSTYLKLVSLNPKVVSVGEEGMLIAIGPGATYVTATYTLGA